mmetsp:Transcript_19764/g.65823  ORF Transcript_19764/g.65823 Transcript_19764/m.65823 type:complete len:83 (+) Transcript_19764:101-349(+)
MTSGLLRIAAGLVLLTTCACALLGQHFPRGCAQHMMPAVIRGGGGVPHANMDLEDVEEDVAEARLRQEQAKSREKWRMLRRR